MKDPNFFIQSHNPYARKDAVSDELGKMVALLHQWPVGLLSCSTNATATLMSASGKARCPRQPTALPHSAPRKSTILLTALHGQLSSATKPFTIHQELIFLIFF